MASLSRMAALAKVAVLLLVLFFALSLAIFFSFLLNLLSRQYLWFEAGVSKRANICSRVATDSGFMTVCRDISYKNDVGLFVSSSKVTKYDGIIK